MIRAFQVWIILRKWPSFDEDVCFLGIKASIRTFAWLRVVDGLKQRFPRGARVASVARPVYFPLVAAERAAWAVDVW